MNVLILAFDTVRGAAERTIWAINTYTEHKAKGLFKYTFPSRYSGTLRIEKPWDLNSHSQIEKAFSWCDVIHCFHEASPRKIDRADIIRKKPIIWQMFTQWDVKQRGKVEWYEHMWAPGDLKYVRAVLVAEGWQRYDLWKSAGIQHSYLPGIFLIDLPEFKPVEVSDRKRVVSFASMKKKEGPPAPKGYDRTLLKLEGLPSDVIFRKPILKCLHRKAHSWCGIDEVVTPIIHFSAFEYAALGVPCISHYDDLTFSTISEVTGCAELPFQDATMGTLVEKIKQLLSIEAKGLEDLSGKIRSWMERFYHPRETIKRYIELYKE